MRLLPDEVYNGERHVAAFQGALGKQAYRAGQARDDFLLQCRPSTATEWGMANHERDWGLIVDASVPLDQRLAAYRARRRGLGTTTGEVVENIARSYTVGDVRVIEHKREFWFEVIIDALGGENIDHDSLRAAIRKVIPAHMEKLYSFVWVFDLPVGVSEEIQYDAMAFKYVLGSWELGKHPFAEKQKSEVVKMTDVSSITEQLLSNNAAFTADDVRSVVLNDAVTISSLARLVQGNTAIIQYALPPDMYAVSNIKLLDAAGRVLSEAAASLSVVPREGNILKHRFIFNERS